MSEPTQEQIQNHARAIQVTADDLAAQSEDRLVQQDKIMGQLNMHLANFNEAQAEVIRLTAENTKLKAQIAAQGTASPVSETTAASA